MVKVHLEGVHYSPKRVRSKKTGKIVVYDYYYAWRGGPRLKGKPGSPQFVQSYQEAYKTATKNPVQNLQYLIDLYTNSPKYAKLSANSKRGYSAYLERIKKGKFGNMPYAVIEDRRSREVFASWHTAQASKPRAANHGLAVLQAVLNWGVDKGKIEKHHAHGIERHKESNRADITWSEEQIAKIHLLPVPIANACRLALWTGQRQGDLLALTNANIHGDFIMLAQSKGGTRVFVYITPTIRAILDGLPRGQSTYLLNGARGYAWRSGFGNAWKKAFQKAGIDGVTFHDLRGTFENRLWQSGCSEPEAFSVTGRKMKGSANSYYQRSQELSKAAMLKLEAAFGGRQSNLEVMQHGRRN